jgi:hypothetical protein
VASAICSIRAFTPNPHRADREVDGESSADTGQIREQVEQADADEQGDDADVDQQRDRRGQAEPGEPLDRQPAAPEGPQLVQRVVVHDRDLDGHDGRGQQRHPPQTVQQQEHAVVDHKSGGTDDGEPAEAGQRPAYRRRRPGPRPRPESRPPSGHRRAGWAGRAD